MSESKHTPGPLVTVDVRRKDGGYPYVMLRNGPTDNDRVVAHVLYLGQQEHANARLLAAGFTSYDKHCGPRAVECAEGDLLGELLEACKQADSCLSLLKPLLPQQMPSWYYNCREQVRSALAKVEGEGT